MGSAIQKARLFSGIILMAYAATHFINHAFGHISIEAMEAGLEWQSAIWQSYLGTTLLYGSLITHGALVFLKLARLNTIRLPIWQWIQILTGISIPYLLSAHIVYTRIAEQDLGIEIDYAQELAQLWPGAADSQTFLLLVVWIHGCIGLHFWLRSNEAYRKSLPMLISLATLIPALSATGWIIAAREQATIISTAIADSGNAIFSAEEVAAAEYRSAAVSYVLQTMAPVASNAQLVAMSIGILLLSIVALRFVLSRTKKRVTVTYGDGTRIAALPGMSLLDVSRQAGIPHMSVCGGRARCSTCRTLVSAGGRMLAPPSEAEKVLLERLKAGPNIRLACQARVRGDVEIRPLIQPEFHDAVSRETDPLGWGVERNISVLFLDIRGFSQISEKSLPYDVVFILNAFFAQITGEIERHGGYVDKFMGDGLMALFGLDAEPKVAARQAVRAAIASTAATEQVSRMLTQHLDSPIRIGIGIHSGDAVIGRIGKTADQSGPSRLTAIGDTVNIAARLESATKEFECSIVISESVADLSDVVLPDETTEAREITVHNISTPINVVVIKEPREVVVSDN